MSQNSCSFCSFLGKHHDNYLFNIANSWEKQAIQLNQEKKYIASWSLSTAARLPYLASAIVDAVIAPIALIGSLFGMVPAVFTWGKQTSLLFFSGKKLIEKINHVCISVFGAIVSPWAAYHIKDVNIVKECLFALESLGDALDRRTFLAINLN